MVRINEHYAKLQSSYLFTDIAKRVETYQERNPEVSIIKMGIGDVTRALPPVCIKAYHSAVDEMADDSTFRGYGPEQGYDFLREQVARVDFQQRGADIDADEVHISDGAKCDTGNFQELLSTDAVVAVQDPVYPVYVDTNVMAGRTEKWADGRYGGLLYLDSHEKNNFIPSPPSEPADVIYLCFPNNPTGAVATKGQLAEWVQYARDHRALILFDAAYAVFIRDPSIPQSIFEIPGAEKVAVEFRSFSKTAGFTGTRCAYTVIPKACKISDNTGKKHQLNELWIRRQTTKFNGVSYPVQRAAAAVYTAEGQNQIGELSDFYLQNATVIRDTMSKLGYSCSGGIHSPYIWIKTGVDSWEYFDTLLKMTGVVCTPGSGFGKNGAGYVRLSAFNSHENVKEAMRRIAESNLTALGG